MVLLNGELGGVVTSLSQDFGTVTTTGEEGWSIKEKLLLKEIISAAVHTYAIMPFYKIHINDLDDMGLELLEYRGKEPMYVIINSATQELNMTLDGNTTYSGVKISELEVYNPLFDLEKMGGAGLRPTAIYDD